ncbi:GTP-binding domain HSR1-related protein [Lasiodiplodia theobromae]|uniref:GTP-binding domain HSR1-related protein n=1 Tax=Lasiodiplodia theobromae TaxID=45133 RepID=UPI0015C40DED|nr:GTP-binding domain HSR1-related protein [Lasiodiplodia theobromae]KAF4546468.1 GTP-binding domain HSR1-related protein [Lasiodiplodia theobromae]
MPSACVQHVTATLMPFLYPSVPETLLYSARPVLFRLSRTRRPRCYSSLHHETNYESQPEVEERSLNPPPDSYSTTPFADKATLMLHAGPGGHGCISFLREKYISEGPANGGDGGTGGSIYIQAVRGETSLHKLARRREIRAGRGKNGQGKLRGGERGEDVLLAVPVGTVVREIWRHDPVEEERERIRQERALRKAQKAAGEEAPQQVRPEKWLLYPGASPSLLTRSDMPKLPGPQRSAIAHSAPQGPIRLDLDKPMDRPLLLVAGAVGGLGNPHFISKTIQRPHFATRGLDPMRLAVQLELKLLADVGLVGLPNAGKSTLIRALSNSRARIGNWAFTTLQPNIGTVVLDDYKGRPRLGQRRGAAQRDNFTIADIPGLIEDAHLDKGLGLGFLRHVERAAILAFVVDLAAGDPVATLKSLWREVGEYETLRGHELNAETQRSMGERPAAKLSSSDVFEPSAALHLEPLALPPMSAKPWFVIATKADLEGTQEKFAELQAYLTSIRKGDVEHPSGKKNAWKKKLEVLPVSAINGETGGTERVKDMVVGMLEEEGL